MILKNELIKSIKFLKFIADDVKKMKDSDPEKFKCMEDCAAKELKFVRILILIFLIIKKYFHR